jgi:hypothetical protein
MRAHLHTHTNNNHNVIPWHKHTTVLCTWLSRNFSTSVMWPRFYYSVPQNTACSTLPWCEKLQNTLSNTFLCCVCVILCGSTVCISYLCGMPFSLNSVAGILGWSVLCHLVFLQFLMLVALCFLFLYHILVTFLKYEFIFTFRYGILQCECGNSLNAVEMVKNYLFNIADFLMNWYHDSRYVVSGMVPMGNVSWMLFPVGQGSNLLELDREFGEAVHTWQ